MKKLVLLLSVVIIAKTSSLAQAKYAFVEFTGLKYQSELVDIDYAYYSDVIDLTSLDCKSIDRKKAGYGTEKSKKELYVECAIFWFKKKFENAGYSFEKDRIHGRIVIFNAGGSSVYCPNGNEESCFVGSKTEMEELRETRIKESKRNKFKIVEIK